MKRHLTPEILDHLPAEDPEAQKAREDLRLINTLMRNSRIMSDALRRLPKPPRHIVELGAGDGTLLLRILQQQTPAWKGGEITFLDFADLIEPQTREGFLQLGWKTRVLTGDVLETLVEGDLILANLFLHHFEGKGLVDLLEKVSQNAPAFLAVEPRRSRFALAGSYGVGLVGCNRVTRHDAVVSVRAGFRNQDLSDSWPDSADWSLREQPVFPFSHVFEARQGDDAFGEK